MGRRSQWTGICFALLVAMLAIPSTARAQGMWMNVAPFPDPREEVLGAAAAGKLYLFAGLIPFWRPAGLVYEYDPAANRWTKRKPMALPSHHIALTTTTTGFTFSAVSSTRLRSAAWVPIDNACRVQPRNRMRGRRSRRCRSSGARPLRDRGVDKIYVIGGATTQPWAEGELPELHNAAAWSRYGPGI